MTTERQRVTLTFEVDADPVAVAMLRQALGDDRKAGWLRRQLEAALERWLVWVGNGARFPLTVSGGRFTVNLEK